MPGDLLVSYAGKSLEGMAHGAVNEKLVGANSVGGGGGLRGEQQQRPQQERQQQRLAKILVVQ
jgi:hypothetical protein